MLRFATSPTSDMSLGDLRIALFNYHEAQERNEPFIVRIEDMESEKNIEGKYQEILDTLALFGIEYTQVIHQSQNVRFHTAMALQLLHEKKAFSCFCSDAWLENKEKYDDACRNLPAELVIDNTSPFRVRITAPKENSNIDSFVIMNQDKTPTYNFSSGVDDMLNDISIIIENENNRSNIEKQDHVRESLAYNKKVAYLYVQELLETPSVKSLLEEGFLPKAISNYLLSTRELKTPTPFDKKILQEMNRQYLQDLDAKELSRYVGFADEEIGELARMYLEDVSTTKELKAKIATIFASRNIPEKFSAQTQKIVDVLKKAPYFQEYDTLESYVQKESGLELRDVKSILRILLTNKDEEIEIQKVYKYIKNYLGEIIK